MAGKLRVSRSRGAFSGVLLILLGIWGGLIPLVGPYVHYAYTPDHTWTITSGRIWLEILPAFGTIVGGITVLVSRLRPAALFGASLAAASGGWFAFGSAFAPLWTHRLAAQGFPVGSQLSRAVEQIGFFTGLGVVIVCVASLVLGRLSVVSIRDARNALLAAEAANEPVVAGQPGTVSEPATVTLPQAAAVGQPGTVGSDTNGSGTVGSGTVGSGTVGSNTAGPNPGGPNTGGPNTPVNEPVVVNRATLGTPAASARSATASRTSAGPGLGDPGNDSGYGDSTDPQVTGTREPIGSGPAAP
jgi:hypothetical protein